MLSSSWKLDVVLCLAAISLFSMGAQAAAACNISGVGPACGFRAMTCGSQYTPSVTQTFAVKGIHNAAMVTISIPNPSASKPNYQLDIKFSNGYLPTVDDTVRRMLTPTVVLATALNSL